MNRILKHRRAPFLFIFVACLALVAGGVAFSQLAHLAACPLCIIQRMLYLALAAAALIGFAICANPWGRRLGALLMAGIAATGAFVSGYQSYLQRFGIESGCSGRMTWWEELVDWAGSQAPLLFQSDGICSDPGWVFLGLSLAEWSLVFFLGFFLLSLYTLLRRR